MIVSPAPIERRRQCAAALALGCVGAKFSEGLRQCADVQELDRLGAGAVERRQIADGWFARGANLFQIRLMTQMAVISIETEMFNRVEGVDDHADRTFVAFRQGDPDAPAA